MTFPTPFNILTPLALAAILATPIAALATTETCIAVNDAEIASLFDRWNSSLRTGEPARVVANYAVESILLPTLSNQPRLTPDEKQRYFESFLKKQPQGTINFRDIMLACNTAIDAGIYTFRFGDGTTVQARYTFTYQWDGQQWLITSHHSSAMPEKS